jgi:hypothetical protein
MSTTTVMASLPFRCGMRRRNGMRPYGACPSAYGRGAPERGRNGAVLPTGWSARSPRPACRLSERRLPLSQSLDAREDCERRALGHGVHPRRRSHLTPTRRGSRAGRATTRPPSRAPRCAGSSGPATNTVAGSPRRHHTQLHLQLLPGVRRLFVRRTRAALTPARPAVHKAPSRWTTNKWVGLSWSARPPIIGAWPQTTDKGERIP